MSELRAVAPTAPPDYNFLNSQRELTAALSQLSLGLAVLSHQAVEQFTPRSRLTYTPHLHQCHQLLV